MAGSKGSGDAQALPTLSEDVLVDRVGGCMYGGAEPEERGVIGELTSKGSHGGEVQR
jgi:hypothetical protein